MSYLTAEIAAQGDRLIRRFGTRNPDELAASLKITVMPRNFKTQNGAYAVITGNPFIFLRSGLDSRMRSMVIMHEIGHDRLHRAEAEKNGGFREFELFNMKASRMEYEANIMAAQLLLPDDEILDYIHSGFDIQQIALAMNSDINLVALKNDILIARGYAFQVQDHNSRFLRGQPFGISLSESV